MERQPTYSAMKIARKYVREIEALNNVQLGDQTWYFIERMLVEVEALYDPSPVTDNDAKTNDSSGSLAAPAPARPDANGGHDAEGA